MKICFFGDAAAHHLRRWARYFTDKGHEVHVITFNPNILNDYEPVKVHLVKKRLLSPVLAVRMLNFIPMIFDIKNLIKNINPDIIHSHSAGGYAWMPALLGFCPFVVTPWGNDVLIDVQDSKVERFFTTFALKKADLIICDGENTKNAVVILGVPNKKIRYITFGVDIQKFRPDLKNRDYFRKKYNLSGQKIVISTRTLNPIHNVETFVRSIPIVLKSSPSAKFIIVGDGSEQRYLINLSQSLNINNAIMFLGKIEEIEMASALQASDIYVSTSLSESGLAASTAEAMACELPVINTDTGDIGLWLKDGECGFIIPTKNPEILAEKIVSLLNNNELIARFGKKNRKAIEENNNYYLEMEKTEKSYKKLILDYQNGMID